MSTQRNWAAAIKYLYGRFSGGVLIAPEASIDNNKWFAARNAADSADVNMIKVDTNNNVIIGPGTTGSLAANSTGILDSNGNPIIGLNPVANAVNYLVVSNRGTGASPVISVAGESGVGLQITSKSTSSISLQTGGTALGGTNQFQVLNTTGANDWMTATGGNNAVTLGAAGGDTTVGLTLTGKGTGSAVLVLNGFLDPLATPASNNTAGAVNPIPNTTLINGVYQRNTAGAPRTDVTDVAANIVTALQGMNPNVANGTSFTFVVNNLSNAANAVTISGGTNVTIQGNGVVANQTGRMFYGVVTNTVVPAVTLYAMGA